MSERNAEQSFGLSFWAAQGEQALLQGVQGACADIAKYDSECPQRQGGQAGLVAWMDGAGAGGAGRRGPLGPGIDRFWGHQFPLG